MIIVQICRPRIGGAVLPVLRGHRHGRRGESRSAALRFKEWAHFREERQGHRGGRNDFCRNSLSTVWKIIWDLRLLEFAVQSLYNFHEQYSCKSSLEENLMYWTSLNAQPSNVSFSMKPLKSIFFNLKKKSMKMQTSASEAPHWDRIFAELLVSLWIARSTRSHPVCQSQTTAGWRPYQSGNLPSGQGRFDG